MAVATLEDDPLSSRSSGHGGSSAEGLVDEIVAAVEAVRDPRTAAVGVGVPSVVEFATGHVRSSVNLHLADLDLGRCSRTGSACRCSWTTTPPWRRWRRRSTRRPGARPEPGDVHRRHRDRRRSGAGGRVYRGTTGAAGELGHTLIGGRPREGVPRAGEFPQTGSLESLAAGRVLDRMRPSSPREPLRRSSGSWRRAGSGRRSRCCQGRTGRGPEAIERSGSWESGSGIGIANAINTFDPDEVVIGGGVSSAGELLLGPATRGRAAVRPARRRRAHRDPARPPREARPAFAAPRCSPAWSSAEGDGPQRRRGARWSGA